MLRHSAYSTYNQSLYQYTNSQFPYNNSMTSQREWETHAYIGDKINWKILFAFY